MPKLPTGPLPLLYLLLTLTLPSAILQPSPYSALLFLGVLAAVCFRWSVEPKPQRPASQSEVETLKESMSQLRAELSNIKMYFGLDTSKQKKFSMFNSERR